MVGRSIQPVRIGRIVAVGLVTFGLVACSGSSATTATGPSTNAEAMCRRVFHDRFLNAAHGTVAAVRSASIGPNAHLGANAFADEQPDAAIAWCWTGAPGNYRSYAVNVSRDRVFMGGVAGPLATSTPPPGEPIIP